MTVLWAACRDLDLTITQHGGSGNPNYGDAPAASLMFLLEVPFFAHRNLSHLIMSGVFDRFPELRYVMTEQGVGWAIEDLRRMDGYHAQMSSGRVGELGFPAELVLPEKPSDYFARNVWIGASFPSPSEAAAMKKVGVDRMMWGSDYPHNESTVPIQPPAPAPVVQRLGRGRPAEGLRRERVDGLPDRHGCLGPVGRSHRPVGGRGGRGARRGAQRRLQPRFHPSVATSGSSPLVSR